MARLKFREHAKFPYDAGYHETKVLLRLNDYMHWQIWKNCTTSEGSHFLRKQMKHTAGAGCPSAIGVNDHRHLASLALANPPSTATTGFLLTY